MTLLVISPDYASHLLPLATLATAWRDAGERVVVATGPATDPIVREFGLERYDLPLGRGSNARVIRAEEQPDDESDSLRGFFDATRRGMVPTLRYQASERLTDLMWDPVDAGRRVLAAVDAVRPDAIIVDHLAFSARLALQTAGIPYADVVLGHPSALPVAGEVYGYPPVLAGSLRARTPPSSPICARSATRSRRASPRSGTAPPAPSTPPRRSTADAFGEHGDLVLYNYPAALAEGDGRTLPPHAFLGSTRRIEAVDRRGRSVDGGDAPSFAYVSFGSFLSVRGDVLRRVAEALVEIGMPAAIATGSTPRRRTRADPARLARARVPPAGAAAVAAATRSHPRRQQLGHRGDRAGGAAARAAVLDRPVRRSGRDRAHRASAARSTRTRRRSTSWPQR